MVAAFQVFDDVMAVVEYVRLMMGSDALRRAQISEIETPVSAKKKARVERGRGGRLQIRLLTVPAQKQTPPVLDANVLAEYLKASKLPRKVLNEIWQASVKSTA